MQKNLAKEMVAFASSEGEKILIGVNDQGTINGIAITNRIKSEIQDLARNCDPPVTISFDEWTNVLLSVLKKA
ncbi:AlbA family DNA-binding domain-containing protein [Melioribacter sp. Ez-97]|uniref:AlbA family DNA-binding domain-containing protein n=1 Tax=Melioribacter sp. Ez-97 TaxID=3423434 RepID=UPI003ED9BE4C